MDIKGGVVYILEAQNTKINSSKLYKIGITNNLKKRMNTYNSGNANDVVPIIVFRVKNIHKVETCLKDILLEYQYRNKKEIYEVDVEVIKKTLYSCNDMVNGLSNAIQEDSKGMEKMNHLENSRNRLFLHFQTD